jgi:hypothetical protein
VAANVLRAGVAQVAQVAADVAHAIMTSHTPQVVDAR